MENGSILPELQKKNIVQDLYANAVEESIYVESLQTEGGTQNFSENFKQNKQFFDIPDQEN